MKVTKLSQLVDAALEKGTQRLAVAYGQDINTLKAVEEAFQIGLIEPIITGDKGVIETICQENSIDCSNFKIIHEPDEVEAGKKAVELVNKGEADIIMKGLISSDKYLRAILNKEKGLLPSGKKNVLTHIMITDANNTYHKLLFVSDCAFIPSPDLMQKAAIAQYLIDAASQLGVQRPKVAVLSFSEKVNAKSVSTTDAAILAKMADRGQIKHGDVDGPLALDVAVDMESVKTKKIKGNVAGDADCLLFPNIECANIFYKTITKFIRAEAAAYVVGAKVPVILPSRGDSEKSKLYSIAACCLMA